MRCMMRASVRCIRKTSVRCANKKACAAQAKTMRCAEHTICAAPTKFHALHQDQLCALRKQELMRCASENACAALSTTYALRRPTSMRCVAGWGRPQQQHPSPEARNKPSNAHVTAQTHLYHHCVARRIIYTAQTNTSMAQTNSGLNNRFRPSIETKQ